MENTPSNKTDALTESMNMYIWVIGVLNQHLEQILILQLNFLKNEVASGKSSFFMIGPLCTPHSICLNNGF